MAPRSFLLVLVLAGASVAQAQVAGRVLAAAGEVTVVRGGQSIALTAGTAVNVKDVIRTGEASAVQLRLTDETIVALRAKSEFAIADYRFTGADDGASAVALSLIRGGLRTITGLIGRVNRGSYRLASPVATIGIRGTGYTLVACQQDCLDADGRLAPDGTYGVVFEGRVGVGNDAGEREFGIDEAFYVADAKTLAQPLVGRPGFLRDRLEARARRQEQRREAEQRLAAARAEEAARAEAGTRPPLPPMTAAALAAANMRPVGQLGTAASPIIAAADLRDAGGSVSLLGPGLGAGTAFTGTAQEVALVDGGRGAVVVLDGERGRLEQFSFNSGGVAGERLNAAVLDNGRIEGDGAVTWGRWTDQAAVRVGSVSGKPDTGVHFFFGNLTPDSFFGTLPPGATAVRYEFAGGTRPTNGAGTPGQFLDGLFIVNFLSRTLAGGIRYNVDTLTYEIVVPQTPITSRSGFVGFTHSGTDAGRWTQAGTGASGSIDSYTVSGLFLGSRAQNLGVTYATVDSVAGRSAGVSVFRCTGAGCR